MVQTSSLKPLVDSGLDRDQKAPLWGALIDGQISRFQRDFNVKQFSPILEFCSSIEEVFQSETRTARIRELKATVILSVFFYYSGALTDLLVMPGLGIGAAIFLISFTPLLLSSLVIGPRISNSGREILVTAASIVSCFIAVVVPFLGRGYVSILIIYSAPLTLVYCNATLPLRFKAACINTMVCAPVMVAALFLHPRNTVQFNFIVSFHIFAASVFSLIASYRIEHQMRLNYLLVSRQALQVSGLTADRDFLTRLSNTDALTGVANRRCFDCEIQARLADPVNAEKGVALLMVDVDYFKRYNDRYGHPAGDACLRKVATLLASGLRGGSDMVARYGGEEFAIMLFDLERDNAEAIATRICKAVAAENMEHQSRGDDLAVVTVSMGLAHRVIAPDLRAGMLIAAADQALYAAKRCGRNRVETALALAA